MLDHELIHGFSNIGHNRDGRLFDGFSHSSAAQNYQLAIRDPLRLSLDQGDVLRIDLHTEQAEAWLMAFDLKGRRCDAQFGLEEQVSFDRSRVDAEPVLGWLRAGGSDLSKDTPVSRLQGAIQPIVLKAASNCTVWLVQPSTAEDMIHGVSPEPATVALKRKNSAIRLPDPLGDVREEFTVSRATAMAYELGAGEKLQIIDVEGQQCSDFQALRASALDNGFEHIIDSTATRSVVRRTYPAPGLLDKFCDFEMTPMMRVLQDTCGRHDTFGLACTARGYEERGFPGHVNCSDNISGALNPFGVKRRSAWPAINFFWSTWVDHHNQLLSEESHSRPGDYVVLEALEDLVCVSTACPDDIDPINGWNPTDVHVRIYKPQTSIKRAVAYREKENAPMRVSEQSAFHERLSVMTDQFAPARDLWAPVTFPSHGTLGEYWACRNAATLQDMSALRKFDIIGPDAEVLLQKVMTRDIAKLAVWRGTYALMCDQAGEVIDDGTLFRMAHDLFRWCCGSEESGRWLTEVAEKNGLQVRIHDLKGSMPNLALQGPKSRDILRKIVFTQPHVPSLDNLQWFGATTARLNDRAGAPFMLTRTGYTGELGYEIFCSKADALTIWDAVVEAGEEHGIVPMGSAALEIIRIEAGLAAGGAEFLAGSDAFEAGLGFAVDLKKSDFIGKDALGRNATAQRRHLRGLLFDSNDVPAHGAPIFAGERQVGQITSATRSPSLEKTIAMARINSEHSANGTELEVGQLDGRMKRLTATVTTVPFIDPKRERARA